MSENDLKPCWCGGKGKINTVSLGTDGGFETFITCDKCNREEYNTCKNMAISDWNTRVEPKQESKVDGLIGEEVKNFETITTSGSLPQEPKPEAKEDEIFEMLEKLCKKVHALEGQWDDKKLTFSGFHQALYGAIKQARQELARVIEKLKNDGEFEYVFNLGIEKSANLVRGSK